MAWLLQKCINSFQWLDLGLMRITANIAHYFVYSNYKNVSSASTLMLDKAVDIPQVLLGCGYVFHFGILTSIP